MLEKLKDRHIEALLRVAKKNAGARPFFGSARGMIGLRNEAARRGIYGSAAEAENVIRDVCRQMEMANAAAQGRPKR